MLLVSERLVDSTTKLKVLNMERAESQRHRRLCLPLVAGDLTQLLLRLRRILDIGHG